MKYETLWRRLTGIYDTDEAKAIVRWVLDVRFGLSLTDIVCGKTDELTETACAELEAMMQRLEQAEGAEGPDPSAPRHLLSHSLQTPGDGSFLFDCIR